MDVLNAPQHPGAADRPYALHKLASLLAEFQAAGQAVEPLIAGSGLAPDELAAGDTRLALAQLLPVLQRLAGALPPAGLALRAGARWRGTGLGLHGFALFSSASRRSALRLVPACLSGLGAWVRLRYTADTRGAAFVLEPLPELLAPAELGRLVVEFETALLGALLLDLLGPAFRPAEVAFRAPAPAYATLHAAHFDAPVRFDAPVNMLRLDAAWMDDGPAPMAAAGRLQDPAWRIHERIGLPRLQGAAGEIQRLVLARPAAPPAIDEVAAHLALHPRTLRRRLQAVGTSYKEILADVREHLALGYLRDTRLTNREIAERLGYSDTANFRHAFKRWTAGLPGHYRRS